jgi:hypothetical protein
MCSEVIKGKRQALAKREADQARGCVMAATLID